MRRKDREITDSNMIDDIIMSCDCCRLGFADGKSAYIVPLNFGFESNNGKRTLYFHGAKVGRKIDLIQNNGYAGFELDTNHKLNTGDVACDYSYRFQSVIGEGNIYMITNDDEKRTALQLIMSHYTEKNDWSFPDAMLNATSVFKLEVSTLSCKEHS